jgi:hypothetical protein
MAWLAGSREQITPEQARGAVTGLSDTLNIDVTDATYAVGFIGHPDALDVTFNDGVEHYYGGMTEFTLTVPTIRSCSVSLTSYDGHRTRALHQSSNDWQAERATSTNPSRSFRQTGAR